MNSGRVRLAYYVLPMVLCIAGCGEEYGAMKQRADQLFYTGQYDAARQAYQHALQRNAHDPDTYIKLGKIAMTRADLDTVIELLMHSVTLDADHLEALHMLGEAYFLDGRYTEAIPHFEHVIRLRQGSPSTLELLGASYYRVGRVGEAIATYQRVIMYDPAHRFADEFLGQIYFWEGQYQQARAAFEQARKNNPNNPNNVVALAQLALLRGDAEQGIALLEQAIALRPRDAVGYAALARAYFDEARYEDAITTADLALARNPNDRLAQQYQGLARDRLQQSTPLVDSVNYSPLEPVPADLEAAIRVFHSLSLQDPRDTSVALWLAYLHKIAGRWGTATELYRTLQERYPDREDIAGRLREAELHEQAGSWAEAPEVPTRHFIVKVNTTPAVREDLVERVDEDFERVGEMLVDLLGIAPALSAQPIKLHLFGRPQEFTRYVIAMETQPARLSRGGGFYSYRRNEIALDYSSGPTYRAMMQEFSYAHLWNALIEVSEIPPWLNAGVAEYVAMRMEGTTYFQTTGEYRRDALELALKKDAMMSLEAVLRATSYGDPLFYTAAWGLMTFCAERGPTDTPKRGTLRVYYQDLARSGDSAEAFARTFGPLEQIEPLWREFLLELVMKPEGAVDTMAGE